MRNGQEMKNTCHRSASETGMGFHSDGCRVWQPETS
eukprot:gene17811-23211_t